MQEAVIEYMRRVSDHCAYDAVKRRGLFVAELQQQRHLKKRANFCQGLSMFPAPDKNNVTFLCYVDFDGEFPTKS